MSTTPPPKAPDLWSWLATIRPLGTLIDIGANDGAFGEFLAQFLMVKRAFFFDNEFSAELQMKRERTVFRREKFFGFKPVIVRRNGQCRND